ncbi:MAG TPA: AI-2E family transporter [Bacteroidota bacterium]|nr:AI-2E family transporter [Bacteroidota bacterium]
MAKHSAKRHLRRSNKDDFDNLFQSLGRFEIVLLTGGVLLLLVLIYTIHTILSPFLALGAVLFLLYPLRRYALAKNIMSLSVILFGLWLAYTISEILAPFVLSMLFSYVLNPVVNKCEGWRIPRWITSLVLILLVVGILTLALFFILPIAFGQVEDILNVASATLEDMNKWFWQSGIMKAFERYGVSAEEAKAALSTYIVPRLEDIIKSTLRGMLAFVSSVSQVLTQIFYIILVPFLTFYLLTDFPKVVHRFKMLFPHRRRHKVEEFLSEADAVIGRYLRGALTVAFLQGVLVVGLFSAFQIKYALLLGILAGVLDLVPYVGLIITMVISAIVAAFSEPPVLPKVISAITSIGILHLLEVMLLGPRIIGAKVGLHPLLIILSLLVFWYFLGFFGLLIAVPTTALIILSVREWEANRRGIPLKEYHSIETEE